MPQPVHLQYNSPMQLYSKESAEEQFVQQVGNNAPVALPAADKHFDPAKSATLRYINDQNHGCFGDSTMDKIAAVEAPKQFESQEPGWARYAREKSERARSRTPAASEHHNSGYYTPSSTPAPLSHPVHHENAREFADKQRVYTHNPHPVNYGPSYYQVADQNRRVRTHSEGARSERGYECGGMDYTKGMHFEDAGGDYYSEHRPRQERPRSRPGYECGGSDFGKGYVAPGPYHGHGPDPPRLRSHYSADPRSLCNAYIAPNVDYVDANLLVGDTLSNQKCRQEVRHIDQNEFGTSFGPPGGFKRDHMTVHRAPAAPEPVTFCVSAPSNVAPRSSAPAQQQNVWMEKQQETDREVNVQTLLSDEAIRRKPNAEEIPQWREKSMEKQMSWENRRDPRLHKLEVYTTEPNWSRNVEQRRNAWERKANETDVRVGLPASAKVAPDAPPAWHNKAVRAHNVWQNAADNMHQVQHQNYHSSYSNQQTHDVRSPQPSQQQQHNQYENQSRSEYKQESHTTPFHGHYDSNATNAQQLINSGYNQNQVDYILNNPDKFGPGRKYNPSNTSSYQAKDNYQSNSSNYNKIVSNGHVNSMGNGNVVNRQHNQDGGFSNNYSTTNHEEGQLPQGGTFTRTVTESRSSSHNTKPANYSTETHITHAPFANAPPQAGHFAPSNLTSNNNYQSSSYNKSTSSQNISQPIALPAPALSPAASYKSYSSSHYSKQEKTTNTTGGSGYSTAPQVTTTLPVTKTTSYSYSTTSQPSQPAPISINQNSYTNTTEKAHNALPASNYYSENYSKSHREENHREESSRPVSQLSQYSESRNYKRNYEEKTETTTIPATLAPITTNYTSSSSNNLSSATNINDVFDKKKEMNEHLPKGTISNTHNNTQGGYRDREGHDVSYKRELSTAADPGREYALLKEEEKRVVETPMEPGVISRHVTTKYYKKKTVTDTTTTPITEAN
ncbi:unnamed protein product [Auanema sp. JU1783]|nr:unnamed protein product [Auanema sp. JU1783]